LRTDRDYNNVDLWKTRKRYVVKKSLDFTRNMFWLASCFSKIKKPNSHFLGNQRGIAGVHIFDTTPASMRAISFIDYHNDELAGRTIFIHGTIVPYWKDAVGLGSFVCHPKSKKTDGKADQAVDDEPYINKRKLLSTMATKGDLNNDPSPKTMDGNGNQVVNNKPFVDKRKPSNMTAVKGNFHNGEHTLIPVTVKMIHSAVQDCKRFILKDGQPLHMVKLVGAVRNFCMYVKHIQIDLEDGTGLVRVIFWRKQKECMAQHHLIEECNGNRYIRVIGKVADYYGVHEIISFDIQPVSSGNKEP
jgi:hypothetical protein